MRDVYVRSVKCGQVALQVEHSFTSLLTRSCLRSCTSSTGAPEATASKATIALSLVHPHFRGVIDGHFFSLVDVTDSMDNKLCKLRYVVNLQVWDTGVVDAAGQWEDSRAACLLVTKSHHICLIDGMEFDHGFDLVSIGKFLADRCLFEVSLGFVDSLVCSDCGERVMVKFEASFMLFR